MKRIRFILTLAFAVAAMALQAQVIGSVTTDDGLQFNAYHDSNGDYAAIVSGANYTKSGLIIPETIQIDGVTYPVEAIFPLAFQENKNITVVVCSKNLTRISYQAFMSCTNLQQIVWYNDTGANIKTLGDNAFRACSALTSVIVPEGLEEIPRNCFTYCTALTDVTLPPNLKKTGVEAFSDCTSLQMIIMPDGVEEISEKSFYRCSALTTVISYAPKLKKICKYAFAACPALKNLALHAPELDSICAGAFNGCKVLESFTVPESVKGIGSSAFSGCEALAKITLPNRLTEISNSMFYQCKKFRDFDMPDNCTSIGATAFMNSGLQRATLPGRLQSVGKNAFWSCLFAGSGATVQHLYNLQALPVSVTGLADAFSGHISGSLVNHLVLHVPSTALEAYQASADWNVIPKEIVGCDSIYLSGYRYQMDVPRKRLTIYKHNFDRNITTLTIPAREEVPYSDASSSQWAVKGIASETFAYMSKLTRVDLQQVDSLGYGAFGSCSALTTIKGDSLRYIGQRAFEYCSKIKVLDLPASLEKVETAAFIGASGITSVTVRAAGPPAIYNGAFNADIYSNATLFVPAESLELYRNATGWKEFANIKAIVDVIKGDLNGDGSVDGNDVSILLEMALSGGVSDEQIKVADLNDDQSVDGNDVSILLEKALSGD